MSYFDYERTLLGYLDGLKMQLLARPLNLGGVASSGGGAGGATGYIGQLPQSRVAFDLTEAALNTTPVSGASLLDNLNHIRYRVQTLEETTGPGSITVLDDGVLVSSGITTIDFIGGTVSLTSSDSIAVAFSGTGGSAHSHIHNETVTGTNHFDTARVFESGTLEVYYNGIRQDDNYFVVDGDYQGFTLVGFTAVTGDEILVDYDITASGGGGGSVTSLGDLSDVDLSTPPTNSQALIYDSGTSKWKPGTVATSGTGGGGAPTNAEYVLSTANATLSGAIVIPGLAGSADRQGIGGAGFSEEFDGADTLTWTGTKPTTYELNTVVPSYLHVVQAGSNTGTGVAAWSPVGGNGTAIIKLHIASFSSFGLVIGNDDITEGARYQVFRSAGAHNALQPGTCTGGTWTNRGTSFTTTGRQTFYFKIVNDYTNSLVSFYHSDNGLIWQFHTSYAFQFTPTRIGIWYSVAVSNTMECMVDFIRGT